MLVGDAADDAVGSFFAEPHLLPHLLQLRPLLCRQPPICQRLQFQHACMNVSCFMQHRLYEQAILDHGLYQQRITLNRLGIAPSIASRHINYTIVTSIL